MGRDSNDCVTLSWSCRRACPIVDGTDTGEWIMATVIDIDSHFEPGDDWLKPYPKLAARLPKLNPALLAVDTICGDLLHDVPEDRRPPLESLYPPGLMVLFGQEKAAEADRRKE